MAESCVKIVMTMVNTMLPSVSKQKHTTKLNNIEKQLRDVLRENGVPDNIALNVPLVPAGYEDEILQYEKRKWMANLFGQCLARVDKTVVVSLLQIRYKTKFLTKITGLIIGAGAVGTGAELGALIGVIGGPVGAGAGAIIGAVAGGVAGAVGGVSGAHLGLYLDI